MVSLFFSIGLLYSTNPLKTKIGHRWPFFFVVFFSSSSARTTHIYIQDRARARLHLIVIRRYHISRIPQTGGGGKFVKKKIKQKSTKGWERERKRTLKFIKSQKRMEGRWENKTIKKQFRSTTCYEFSPCPCPGFVGGWSTKVTTKNFFLFFFLFLEEEDCEKQNHV